MKEDARAGAVLLQRDPALRRARAADRAATVIFYGVSGFFVCLLVGFYWLMSWQGESEHGRLICFHFPGTA
mgnify:CR=1 FL=1